LCEVSNKSVMYGISLASEVARKCLLKQTYIHSVDAVSII